MSARYHVFIVSDATGLSAETAARAALAQFDLDRRDTQLHRHVGLTSTADLPGIVREAKAKGGVILHTLATADWSKRLSTLAQEHHVRTLDLLGLTVQVFSEAFGVTPRETPSPHHRLDAAYFQRIEAMEWTVRHDDGRAQDHLIEADIVLIGVSRVSKTPLCIYLANRGCKAANVPLVPGVPVGEQIFTLPRGRVFGLTIDAQVLLEIRRNRVKQLGGSGGEYASPAAVQAELAYAEDIFRRGRFPVIDVTGRAVEETAAEIERVLERRAGRARR
ncbi:pyruvate, water dikinase regulatory protein [Deinococcus peraridilitoris]|uniref:Putative pyruvate, phosphate dikinase regulatory protein n=1 Tax=Deinococcus peraridilitoris (strain DSM 19664 / LMG 22246 / CIP 109416 / KR-200) TaxID=937777 RepID=L0A5Q8_DEIPD|nr:pyruvate, water dikinase regulatory protein [Deinococcus peraridilitoris]AFZ68355.1 hypothetical protein Deipe_2894 [Deinococcus peraridilitoris DSM 19664]